MKKLPHQQTGNWSVSGLFSEVDVAFKWKIPFDEFQEKDMFTKAIMTEYIIESAMMESWESQQSAKKSSSHNVGNAPKSKSGHQKSKSNRN